MARDRPTGTAVSASPWKHHTGRPTSFAAVASSPPPIAVDEHGVPADVKARRQAEAVEEAKASGKPEQIAQKMAEGKMRKFFEEVTLLGQKYVRDDKKAVKDVLPAGAAITRFVRMTVGQG